MSLHLPSAIVLVATAAFQPRLLIPHLVIRDLRQLDFVAMRSAGYNGAVFDKDNCLTLPLKDHLIPELTENWTACKNIFGKGRVLVVSNSAGTTDDAGGIQAESVSHALGVPVLTHLAKKPGWPCVRDVRRTFAASTSTSKDSNTEAEDHHLAVIGDRILTDVVLAHRLARTNPSWSLTALLARKSATSPQFRTLAVLVDPWEPRDAKLLRRIENGWLSLARRITGLQDAPLTDMQGNHLTGVRVLDGWQDQVRPFVRSWDPKWDRRPRKAKSSIGAAEWEGH